MRFRPWIAAGLALMAFRPVQASSPAGPVASPGICGSEEQSLFNCDIGKKHMSICASKYLTNDAGYIQYRFGDKSKLEMVFPTELLLSQRAFRFSNTGYGGGWGSRLRFTNKGYEYIVFEIETKGPFEADGARRSSRSSGILIRKDGKRISTLTCQNPIGANFTTPAYEVLDTEPFDDALTP